MENKYNKLTKELVEKTLEEFVKSSGKKESYPYSFYVDGIKYTANNFYERSAIIDAILKTRLFIV